VSNSRRSGKHSLKRRERGAEQVLISRILAGEKDLFLELVRPYQRTVYATVISMLGSKEDAEDVTQDLCSKPWRVFTSFVESRHLALR
jgi:RNA polymerase sigma-70 factor (ECF subfamily)